jgi:ubiquitin-protein ligase
MLSVDVPRYPDERPRLLFLTPVFHPLVDPKTFEMDLTQMFPEWHAETCYVWQILKFLKAMLLKIEIEPMHYSNSAVPNPTALTE